MCRPRPDSTTDRKKDLPHAEACFTGSRCDHDPAVDVRSDTSRKEEDAMQRMQHGRRKGKEVVPRISNRWGSSPNLVILISGGFVRLID